MTEKRIDEVYLREDQKKKETKEDFEKKDINLESFPIIKECLSEADLKIYHDTLDTLQKVKTEILEKLSEKYRDPESAMIFISDLNEAMRKNNE